MADPEYQQFLAAANKTPAAEPAAEPASAEWPVCAYPPLDAPLCGRLYVSEADEPFCSLHIADFPHLPPETRIGRVFKLPVRQTTASDFDPHNSYADVVDLVRQHADAGADVLFFRAAKSRSETLYYILAPKGDSLVGTVVLVVES